MELSRIKTLDLRTPEAIEAERVQAAKDAQDRALDRMWNFPRFPAKVAEFIETGRWPRHSIKVRVVADTASFMASMRRMQEALDHLARIIVNRPEVRVVVAGTEWGEDYRSWQRKWYSRRRRSMRSWHWPRILFASGLFLAVIDAIGIGVYLSW